MRTFRFELVAYKSLDQCKAAGVKKLWLQGGYSYAGQSKRRLVEITSDKKYLKFDTNFTNKVKSEKGGKFKRQVFEQKNLCICVFAPPRCFYDLRSCSPFHSLYWKKRKILFSLQMTLSKL